ncbi:hypothetical protein RFI_13009 [Reticulomyxa filosa]|uniref:Uncharacterized protein n=1 Tax=Reticulomyxa filosa TaxID=46433 RepID=X6NEH2_RETFI|nr:hypothetical protein RFI_13009 [Reticulomyxa filosa]|eukprot:ETO24154.1 hypothetical protein RFI_13009 [Reticulomyxa filosa]
MAHLNYRIKKKKKKKTEKKAIKNRGSEYEPNNEVQKGGGRNDREESEISNKAEYEGGEDRRFTHLAWSETNTEAEEDASSELVWSPNNSLAVLTFRMHHGSGDEGNEQAASANTNSARNLHTGTKKSDITSVEDYNSARNLHSHRMDADLEDAENGPKRKRVKTSLYDIAKSVYDRFIVEGSEMEINISSKSRSNLHFFFHQQNLPMPKGTSNLSLGNNPLGHTKNSSYPKKNTTTQMVQTNLHLSQEEEKVDQSSDHLYRLYHIFDGAWAEIWHLLSSNVYPRFVTTDHYLSIKQRLFQELEKEKLDLYRIVSSEDNSWFDHIKPRKLEIVGVKALPVDEQVALFGKPVVRVKNAKV